tara:strand:- start:456 stop:650 length:195 start_codon:yes stop_codon:yes gene_type:complete
MCAAPEFFTANRSSSEYLKIGWGMALRLEIIGKNEFREVCGVELKPTAMCYTRQMFSDQTGEQV